MRGQMIKFKLIKGLSAENPATQALLARSRQFSIHPAQGAPGGVVS